MLAFASNIVIYIIEANLIRKLFLIIRLCHVEWIILTISDLPQITAVDVDEGK